MSERDVETFADRVMTAIKTVPAPTPVRSFGWSLRAREWRDAVVSLQVAWHLGTVRDWSVAPRVRARSFALVLAVASVLATGSIVAAAAVRVAVPGNVWLPPAAPPATQVSSAPIVDGPGLDDSDHDGIQMPTPPPVRPGAAGAEPTANPSSGTGKDDRHSSDGAAGTTRSRHDADDGALDGDTEAHDGSGDSGHEVGGAEDGHDGGTDDGGQD